MYSHAEAIRDGWDDRAAEFAAWRNEVDKHVAQHAGGMTSEDLLGDWGFADAFESGITAESAAHDILDEAGWNDI